MEHVLLLILLLTARNNLLHLALFCQDASQITHFTNSRNPLQNTRSNKQSARYACIVGHFATAATETIVEEGHSGANQGEIKQ